MKAKSKRHVLVVDDDEAERNSYCRFLAAAGFAVTQASDGREALALVESDDFDCIISDLSMPDIDGLGLLRRVRTASPDSPFVLVLDGPDNHATLKAQKWGAIQSLVKPLDAESLQETAKLAISSKARRAWDRPFRNRHGQERRPTSVSATSAKTEFARVLEMAIQGDAVVITKHDAPKAILISVEEFDALSDAKRTALDTLSADFDALMERMQAPRSAAAIHTAFGATPEQLADAALASARKR